MKAVETLCNQIERRLEQTWHLSLAGDQDHWPHRFSLGKVPSASLASNFAAVQEWTFAWRDWAREHELALEDVTRRTAGISESLPSHVTISDLDTAARTVANGWPQRLRTGRRRLNSLLARFPEHSAPHRVLRASQAYSEADFDLLCTAALWFQSNARSGLSPRQVPIEGLHSKWLNSHRAAVLDLAGADELGLVEVRAPEVNFTYLDPDYRSRGGRIHDSVVPGDAVTPAYPPQVVVISENKDTAILFPELSGGISVQGHGNAGPSLISRVPFLASAPRVFYWGDLDAKGLEIVNEYRRFEVDVETLLMDETTLERYARFRADTDEHGRPLKRSTRKTLRRLTAQELAVYLRLTEPDSDDPIRVEQERIPLHEAAACVLRALGNSQDHPAERAAPGTSQNSKSV
ncbi:MAG: Wadjet anti-phage system protein JetD domain-containing protein [Propionibacteriaceae bacterium]